MIIIFLKMTVAQGREKGEHTKTREGKSEFLQKNKYKKNSKDYLSKYSQKPEMIAKRRKDSKEIVRYYKYKPETSTIELVAIGKNFDNFSKKRTGEKLDEILKDNFSVTENGVNIPLLGIIYGLLNEKGTLTSEGMPEIYQSTNWREVLDKMTGNYSRIDGEGYIAMLTRYHLQDEEEEEKTSAQNIYK